MGSQRLGGLPRITQPVCGRRAAELRNQPRDASESCRRPPPLCALHPAGSGGGRGCVRTGLQKGDMGVREGGQVGSGDRKGIVSSYQFRQVSLRCWEHRRSRKGLRWSPHWVANQAECLRHEGRCGFFVCFWILIPAVHAGSSKSDWPVVVLGWVGGWGCSETFPGDSCEGIKSLLILAPGFFN